ncbi:DEAD/DEAH box helicase [Sporosarcina limicola]|uniref:SNF2 family DNA or RNA helicase n=1 Tax=Sporosarcina limicola TaxID=34101 RepID=A0A927RE29_9BACL|nr:DEAD/DEAH box helicase [Sporosarcina limicola]MBE1555915.1 SNF2 family DNA or RNA helicase [Sporosarcina limicola]
MNRLTQQLIQSFYATTTFTRGKSYFTNGRVQSLNYDYERNTWSARVIGSEVYNTWVRINDQKIEDSCNCGAYENSGDCKHVCATLLAIVDDQKTTAKISNNKGTKNARYQQATKLMDYFGNNSYKAPGLTVDAESYLKVEFLFRAHSDMHYNNRKKDVFEIQMKIGEQRLYIVKDIRTLLDNISNKTEMEFGKHFTYSPDDHLFTPEDSDIIDKLIEVHRTESLYNTNDYYWASNAKKGKELLIPLYAADDLLFKLQHRNCNFEQQNFVYGQLQITEEDLPFSFTLENGKSGEYQLKISGNTAGQYFETYGWYALSGKLYKLSPEQQRALQPFVPLLSSTASPVIPIAVEQVEAFVSQAMPKMKQIGKVEVSKKVSTIIINPTLRVKMFVDGSDEGIDVKVEYHYDSIIINPVNDSGRLTSDDQMILIRDAEQELDFMHELERSSLKVRNDQYYSNIEEDVFDFLYNRLFKLEDKAEIFLAPAIKSLILPSAAKATVSVNIQSNGNLLDVDFTIDGIDQQKVAHILQSIIEKKKYVRLPNGAFLSLMDEQLQDVADLYEELNNKSVEMIDGKMKMPLYRGLQIEERLTKLDKQTRKFGKTFRQFFNSIKSPEEEDFQIPTTLQANLRDYQLTGFKWLKSLAQYQLGGILADDMGLGKTVQCIAYILSEMEDKPSKPFLVVAPASLVYNWKNEFSKFAPDLHVEIATGTVQERKSILEQEKSPDVYITSYHTLRQDLEWYSKQEFHSLILDEAQSIKNYASKISQAVRSITASKRFALSGTPIENSLDELWAIFQAIMPGFLHDQKTFRSLKPKTIARLVKPFILRRLKKDVLKELPDKIETVHYSELQTEQKELYLGYLDKIRMETKESLATEGIGKGRIKILAGLTRLRQLCCHPSLFIDNYEGKSGKLEELLEIIENGQENGRKMLIFSQFSSMLKIIQETLVQSGQSCFYLDGKTPAKERVKLVDDFNEGTESIFLISLKAGGTGLNLTGADTVILYDLWWNPAIEEQAIGRAHRMGQKNVVQVVKLIAQGTIEEKINELQQSKKELIDQVIQTGETMLSSLSESDIREILSI